MEVVFIYTLIDPITDEVRYVGKSIKPERRYREHLTVDSNTHKSAWIKSLLKKGMKPTLKVIEECDEGNWSDREKYWVSQYDNLTNLTEGGEDGSHSEETIEKLSLLNSGENNPNYGKRASKELRDKLSELQIGKVLSERHKEKLTESSKKRSIVIDGVVYESIIGASRGLGLTVGNIHYRVNSTNYPQYTYFFI